MSKKVLKEAEVEEIIEETQGNPEINPGITEQQMISIQEQAYKYGLKKGYDYGYARGLQHGEARGQDISALNELSIYDEEQ